MFVGMNDLFKILLRNLVLKDELKTLNYASISIDQGDQADVK